MTRSQIREKYGISMLESPSVANKELSEKEAAEYEDCVSLHLRMFDEIDENIEKFCSRCKYYRTAESDKSTGVPTASAAGISRKPRGFPNKKK